MTLLDPTRLDPRLGAYAVGPAAALSDPLLWPRVQEVKRLLGSRMTAIAREELRARVPAGEMHVSRKVDGEFTVLVVDGDAAFTLNPGGTVRAGLACIEEARALLRGQRVLLVGELYLFDPARRTHVHDVTGVLNRPAGVAELDRVRFAAFDLLEPHHAGYDATWKALTALLAGGTRVHPVEGAFTKKLEDVEAAFRAWVENEGSEGIVVRSDAAGLFKVKNRRTLDVVVVGFSEGIDDRKGLVHDLLIALMRADGTFHVLGRVGGGFTEDERRSLVAELGPLAAPSDYTEVNPDHLAYQMLRPERVIEISFVDLLTQTTRGGPIERMVLSWDGGRYSVVRRLPLAALIGPTFVRRRDDKRITPTDLRLGQIADLVEVPLADRDARSMMLPASELVRREVWTKVMRGQTMVRKLLLWKTNKDRDSEDHPAYVLYHTDFSPNREEPLQREVRIGRTLEEMERHWQAFEKEKILKGWFRAKER
jgi:hypothetical protein